MVKTWLHYNITDSVGWTAYLGGGFTWWIARHQLITDTILDRNKSATLSNLLGLGPLVG